MLREAGPSRSRLRAVKRSITASGSLPFGYSQRLEVLRSQDQMHREITLFITISPLSPLIRDTSSRQSITLVSFVV